MALDIARRLSWQQCRLENQFSKKHRYHLVRLQQILRCINCISNSLF